jgi:hypothetical protein
MEKVSFKRKCSVSQMIYLRDRQKEFLITFSKMLNFISENMPEKIDCYSQY